MCIQKIENMVYTISVMATTNDLNNNLATTSNLIVEIVNEIVKDPWLIRTAPQTEVNCFAAVQNNGMALRFIKPENQTDDICLAAVRNHGYALLYVENQTCEIIEAAVSNNGFAAQFINPNMITSELIDKLVEHNYNVVHVLCCNEDQWRKAIVRHPMLVQSLPRKFHQPTFINSLIKSAPGIIKYIDQTEELCQLAVMTDPAVWKDCHYQPDSLMEKVYSYDPKMFISHTHAHTQEYFIVATRKDPKYAAFVDSLILNQVRMVRNNQETLQFMYQPLPDVIRYAIITNPACIKYVPVQTQELQQLALSLDPSTMKYFTTLTDTKPIEQKIVDAIHDKIPDSNGLHNLTMEIIQSSELNIDNKAALLKKLFQY